MKKRMYIAWFCLLCLFLCSCTSGTSLSANDPEALLSQIWAQYHSGETFAVYGGSPEDNINGKPGKLSNTDAYREKFLIPENQLSSVKSAASLTHMMNSNVFTAGMFRLNQGTNIKSFASAVRDNLKANHWLCGSPEKLLIAAPEDGQLLIAYGSQDAVILLYDKLLSAFPNATLYYHQDV